MPRKKAGKGKVEITWDDDECCKGPWKKWMWKKQMYGGEGKGFLGRVLFAIGVLMLLNSMGVFKGQPNWLIWLIGIGFALMRL